MKLVEFLNDQHVPYTRLPHQTAYTANHIAQTLHVPGKDMAKTVLVRTAKGHLIAVLPATHRIDLQRLRQQLGEEQAELATESEMETLFPECERGAMPPFGSLYHLPTLVDETIAEDDEIVFEGENHQEAIRMKYRDYESVEHPKMGQFACRG